MNKVSFDNCVIKLKMSFNKELYDEGIISFEIFDKMQKLLSNKMDG